MHFKHGTKFKKENYVFLAPQGKFDTISKIAAFFLNTGSGEFRSEQCASERTKLARECTLVAEWG